MSEEYRRIWLPYCIKKMNDAIGGWIVLNRRYKPLGMPTDDWVVYEDVPRYVRIKRITLSQQKKIHHGCIDAAPWLPNDMIWLYHDGCRPTASSSDWNAYQRRLLVLSSLNCFGPDEQF
jgi:hypothetical protein